MPLSWSFLSHNLQFIRFTNCPTCQLFIYSQLVTKNLLVLLAIMSYSEELPTYESLLNIFANVDKTPSSDASDMIAADSDCTSDFDCNPGSDVNREAYAKCPPNDALSSEFVGRSSTKLLSNDVVKEHKIEQTVSLDYHQDCEQCTQDLPTYKELTQLFSKDGGVVQEPKIEEAALTGDQDCYPRTQDLPTYDELLVIFNVKKEVEEDAPCIVEIGESFATANEVQENQRDEEKEVTIKRILHETSKCNIPVPLRSRVLDNDIAGDSVRKSGTTESPRSSSYQWRALISA